MAGLTWRSKKTYSVFSVFKLHKKRPVLKWNLKHCFVARSLTKTSLEGSVVASWRKQKVLWSTSWECGINMHSECNLQGLCLHHVNYIARRAYAQSSESYQHLYQKKKKKSQSHGLCSILHSWRCSSEVGLIWRAFLNVQMTSVWLNISRSQARL